MSNSDRNDDWKRLNLRRNANSMGCKAGGIVNFGNGGRNEVRGKVVSKKNFEEARELGTREAPRGNPGKE